MDMMHIKYKIMYIIILLIIYKRTQATLWLLADHCADPQYTI